MKLEPGPALKTELIWWLRPEGGGRIRSASAAGLSSITLSLMVPQSIQLTRICKNVFWIYLSFLGAESGLVGP